MNLLDVHLDFNLDNITPEHIFINPLTVVINSSIPINLPGVIADLYVLDQQRMSGWNILEKRGCDLFYNGLMVQLLKPEERPSFSYELDARAFFVLFNNPQMIPDALWNIWAQNPGLWVTAHGTYFREVSSGKICVLGMCLRDKKLVWNMIQKKGQPGYEEKITQEPAPV